MQRAAPQARGSLVAVTSITHIAARTARHGVPLDPPRNRHGSGRRRTRLPQACRIEAAATKLSLQGRRDRSRHARRQHARARGSSLSIDGTVRRCRRFRYILEATQGDQCSSAPARDATRLKALPCSLRRHRDLRASPRSAVDQERLRGRIRIGGYESDDCTCSPVSTINGSTLCSRQPPKSAAPTAAR